MKQIVLPDLKPDKVMEIVRELRKGGLVQGVDFDFKYCPVQYNNDGWEQISTQHTVFTFYEEKYATWFAIKWS